MDNKLEIVLTAREITGKAFGAVEKQCRSLTSHVFSLNGAVTALGGAGFGYLVQQSLEATAELQKNATMAGVSLKAFQELTFAAGQYAVTQEGLTDGLKELSLRAEEFAVTGGGPAKEAFERLGYGQTELNRKLKDTPALLSEIIDKMQGMENASKMRIADEIFGGQGGEQFVAMINGGSQAIEDFTKKAHDMGFVLDDEMAQGAITANRAINDLTKQIQTQFTTVVAGLAPEIEGVVTHMSHWVGQNKDFISQDIPGHIKSIADQVTGLKGIYDSLPEGVVGAAGAGIVGKMLFGGPIGGFVFGLGMINSSMGTLGMSMGDMVDKTMNTNTALWNFWNSITDALGITEGAIYKTGTAIGAIKKEVAETILPMDGLGTAQEKLAAAIELTELKLAKLSTSGFRSFYSDDIEREIQEVRNLQKELESLRLKQEQLKKQSISSTVWKDVRSIQAYEKSLSKLSNPLKNLTKEGKTAHDSLIVIGVNTALDDFFKGIDKYEDDLRGFSAQAKIAQDSLAAIRVDGALSASILGEADRLADTVKGIEETRREQINLTANEIYDTYDVEGEAYQDLLDDKTKAAKEAWEDQQKESDRALKEQERAYKQMMDNIQDYTADVFYDILDGQIRNWDDLFDTVLDSFKTMLAQMAAAKVSSGVFNFVFGDSGGVSSNSGGIGTTLVNGIAGEVLGPVKDYVWGGIKGLFSSGASTSGIGAATYGVEGIYAVPGEAVSSGATSAVTGGINWGSLGGAVEAGTGATSAATGIIGTAATGAFWAAYAAVAMNLIGHWMDHDDPFTQFSLDAPALAGFNYDDTLSSENYGYKVTADDYAGGNFEFRDAATQYFDSLFDSLDEITTGSIKDILADLPQSFTVKGGAGADALQIMSDGLFSELYGDLLLDMFPDAGTVEREVERLVAREQTTLTAGDDGLGNYGSYLKHIYQTFTDDISAKTTDFNEEFFKAIAPEGGNQWDAFFAFDKVVENTGIVEFLRDFTRQIEEFDETTITAYQNMQNIDVIMEGIAQGIDLATHLNTETVFTALEEEWKSLMQVLEDSHITLEDLAEAERGRNISLGSELTGLSASSIQQSILGGGDIGSLISSAANERLAATFTNTLMETFITDFIEESGRLQAEESVEAANLYAETFDFAEINKQVADFRVNVLGLGSSFTEAAEVVEEVIDRLPELTDQLDTARDQYIDVMDLQIDKIQDEIDIKKAVIVENRDLVDSFRDLKTDISDFQKDLVMSSGVLDPQQGLDFARQQLESTVQGWYSGDPEKVEQALIDLPGVSQDFLDASERSNTDFQKYLDDFGYVQTLLNTSKDIAGVQVDRAQSTIDELSIQTSLLESDQDYYQQQIDLLASINSNILSLDQAREQYESAAAGVSNYKGGGSGSTNDLYGYVDPETDLVYSLYYSLLGKSRSEVEPDGLAYWVGDLKTPGNGITNNTIGQAMLNSADDYPSFDGGGIYSGPTSGGLANLHGIEAVIPLDKGAIPLQIISDGRSEEFLKMLVNTVGDLNKKLRNIEIIMDLYIVRTLEETG